MHFVAALDDVPEMRGVLALFEGVATGAADGYGRMAGKPAATLLHLGPGLGNGLANLHNARRARTPIVNIVGDHATYHKQYDAPLESDIETRGAQRLGLDPHVGAAPTTVGRDAADAVAAATGPPGQVATLILPADVSWVEGAEPAQPDRARTARDGAPTTRSTHVAKALRVGRAGARCSSAAAACASAALRRRRPRSPTRPAPSCCARRSRPGSSAAPGCPPVERLGYLAEFATAQLDGLRHLVLVDAQGAGVVLRLSRRSRATSCPTAARCTCSPPAPTTPSARSSALADAVGARRRRALAAGAAARAADRRAHRARRSRDAVGALLARGRDRRRRGATRSGLFVAGGDRRRAAHDWLTLTGGAIGQGLPVATGAAVACPDRKVVCLEADGSAMYTLQALWTQAREGLDVTTVIFNNRSYAILNLELSRVGRRARRARRRSTCSTCRAPTSTSSRWRKGMGVPAARATTADELVTALERGLAEPGPVPGRRGAAAAALVATG